MGKVRGYTGGHEISGPKGTLTVEGPVSGDKIKEMTMNRCLHNFRPPDRQKEALADIAGMDRGMIFLARHGREIVGYVTFHPPDSFTRWIKHPVILELGGIEVSPEWRRHRLAHELLCLAFSFPPLEDYIIITTEYCWHWDLNGSGLDLWDYQKMLTRLFGNAGMIRRATDDPDINEHPANVLMVRVGKNVSREDVQKFECMLFEGKGI